jgi:hypothetical protein
MWPKWPDHTILPHINPQTQPGRFPVRASAFLDPSILLENGIPHPPSGTDTFYNLGSSTHPPAKNPENFSPFWGKIPDKISPTMRASAFRQTTLLGLLPATLILASCSFPDLNRWEEHKKENQEPAHTKLEAPFDQSRDKYQDDPRPHSSEYKVDPIGEPQIVEGERPDPNREPILFGIAVTGKPGFVLSPYAWRIMKVPPTPEDHAKQSEQTLRERQQQAPQTNPPPLVEPEN